MLPRLLPRRLSTQARAACGGRGAATLAASVAAAGVGGIVLYSWQSAPLLLDASRPPKSPAPLPPAAQPSKRKISMEEVRTHRSKEDCWIALDGVVWDVTTFLELHPAGAEAIVKHAGQDVTSIFKAIHPPKTFEKNAHIVGKQVGLVDLATLAKSPDDEQAERDRELIENNRANLPPVAHVRSLKEMEELAKTLLPGRAGIYYAGGSDDEVSLRDSFASFQRCRLLPRVLVDVEDVDTRTTILGFPSMLPIFVAPAAYARLGHELGEFNLTRAACKTGIVQGISANASQSFEDILAEKRKLEEDGHPAMGMAYQIYVNRDRKQTEAIMREAIKGGCTAFFLTVDSPTLGNRENDSRAQGLAGNMDATPHDSPDSSKYGYYDTSLNWSDLAWIKQHTGGLPLYLKGLATVEDVRSAREHGVQGVVLSNHGGRQCDTARSPLDTLLAIADSDPKLMRELEIYIDGGVRRGTDVLKALAIGAKGVGLGRPFLYGQTAYGEDGAIRTVRIMENEILTGMRLLGVRKLSDIKPEHIECLDNMYRTPGGRRKQQE